MSSLYGNRVSTCLCPFWLLEHKSSSGFTIIQSYGHGSDPTTFTIIEQVEGRKEQVIFQIHIASNQENDFIKNLKESFKGTNIHY
ncbi:MAG: DUF3240 domain-containing protein [Proteobacteria bacterium]|nr:DUF3240 domain-containing protein [Pseudomonadota bacterium]